MTQPTQTPIDAKHGLYAALSIAQFCAAHQISRTLLYELDKTGRGPRRMHVGRRVLISVEAARDWRAQMESAR